MRRLLVVVALSACAARTGSGPAWPQSHNTDSDGGESLAPHTAQSVVARPSERVEDVRPVVKPSATVGAAAPATGDAPPASAPGAAGAAPLVQETITTEDIVIEIDD
jgi:hypothetical protein